MNYKEYNSAIDALIRSVRIYMEETRTEFSGVFAVPRGGYYPAIRVAQELSLPVVLEKEKVQSTTLVVDDIYDTGETINKLFGDHKNVAVVYVNKKANPLPKFFGEYMPENWIEIPDEGANGIEDNIRRIFQYIGENPDRVGLKGTPDRIVRMFKEIFRGYDPKQKPKITTFPNGEDGLTYDNMVVDEGNYYSCCEHHMMPFFGHYWFAYIPNPKGRILGISKVGRVVDYCAAKLQVQERLTKEVVDMLTEALGEENPPLGVALVMRGKHLCKSMRGVKKDGYMTSSYLTGAFRDDSEVRAEFMNFVQNGK